MTPARYHKLRQVLARRQPDLTVLAEGVHKSHNVAAILRTCDAVGVYRAHAVSPDGRMRRHHLITAGVDRWMRLVLHPDTGSAFRSLRADGWQLITAHHGADSVDYREVDYTAKVAIVMGTESYGVSRHALTHADQQVAIPMRGMVESLNVSVATALILFEAARQREAAGCYEQSRLSDEQARDTLFEWAYPYIARKCRALDRPYPSLSADGSIESNPLTDIRTGQRRWTLSDG